MKKACTKCGEVKSFSEFSPHSLTKDGLQSWCRECRRQWRQYQYRTDPKFRERERRQGRAYQAALTALRDRHRDEFDQIYREELG